MTKGDKEMRNYETLCYSLKLWQSMKYIKIIYGKKKSDMYWLHHGKQFFYELFKLCKDILDRSKTMSRNIWIEERLWRQTSHLKITEPLFCDKSAHLCRTREHCDKYRDISADICLFWYFDPDNISCSPNPAAHGSALTWSAIIYRGSV